MTDPHAAVPHGRALSSSDDGRISRNARGRRAALTAAGAVAAVAGLLAILGEDALAGPKDASRRKRAAVVGRTETPLGLQGLRGSGGNIVIPFTLVDPTRVATDVEAQFAIDANGDGLIQEDEYKPATEDRQDPRDTRRNKKPQLYVTAGDIGATHAFVWRSTSDIASNRYETLLYQVTNQGRLIPDPAHPGEFLFDDALAGVRFRLRAVRGKGSRRLVGEWGYTDAFSVNNNSLPSMTIDAVLPNASGTASDELVSILWTAKDPDSEDANSNGQFDPGEDVNGDSFFNQEQVGVAFDYYRLQPGDDPSSMSDTELAALAWLPCTRAAGVGDTDSFREPAPAPNQPDKRIFATPDGRQWTFVWDSIADVGTVNDRFVLRARPVDAKREIGNAVYVRSPITIDNWKVFSSGAGGNADISMSAARSGATVTNLVYGLEQSDASYGKPFQQMVVAGGADSAGQPVRTVDVFLVNSETADTTTATAVSAFAAFTTARRFHTATMLQDGRVLFAGGFDGTGAPTGTTEIYDPKSRSMSAGPDLGTPRARHSAVLLSTGDVAFIGGVTTGGTLLSSVEFYNFTPAGEPQAANTPLATPLSTAQHSASAVLLPNQKVLITGGITGAADATGAAVTAAQLLDPLASPVDAGVPGGVKSKNPSLETTGSMAQARKFAGVASLLDGNVLISGGFTAGAANASMEVFNWKLGAFEPVTVPMQDGGRSQHVSEVLGDGSVLLAGGTTGDPSAATPPLTAAADVFRLGARDDVAGTWTGSFAPVNGDMVVARRAAGSAVTMNGRTFVAGGLDASGEPIAKCEVYTPDGSRNTAPKVHVFLPSSNLSHKFGAPIYFRLVDVELDQARVQAQFRVPGGTTWFACTLQDETIGGDFSEDPAGLATTTVDKDFDELAIDPLARNTAGDHILIWAMSQDIDRPAEGQSIPGYNIRIIPFGAVRGPMDVTDPVNVLYNTKAITTILPLEDAPGFPNPRQGGDIRIAVHLRDVDGAGTTARNGDEVSAYFEYALDLDGDGQITSQAGEIFRPMSPAKRATGNAYQTNPITELQTWSEAYDSPESDPDTRPASKGWATFDWDALYDLGPPPSPTFEVRNVWIRVTASDADSGFPRTLRNTPQSEEFVYIRDLEALQLASWMPRGGNKASVKVNEPIDFFFLGNVEPSSANANTIRISRGSTQLLGVFEVRNDTVNRTSVVTWYPQPQNLSQGTNVFGVNDAATVLFPLNTYQFVMPGYVAGQDPTIDVPPTLRPLGQTVATDFTSTFQLVHSEVIDGSADSSYRFTTGNGYYDDGEAPDFTVSTPSEGATLAGPADASGFSLTFDHAVDVATVTSPHVRVTVSGIPGATPVVPGRWSVTNTVLADGSTRAVLVFEPLLRLPSGGSISVDSGTGLLGTSGRAAASTTLTSYVVFDYGRDFGSIVEGFSDDTNADTAGTDASWGADACTPGVLTGSQDGATPPQGGNDLVVTPANSPYEISSTTVDFNNITVQKGAILRLRASAPMTIRALGNIRIDGTVDFAGIEGESGSHGNNYYNYGPTYAPASVSNGQRRGGGSYNGGGAGGASTFASSDHQNGGNGAAGAGTSGTGGQGGQIQTQFTPRNSYYYYGAGGGAGGGHARAGFAGGNVSQYTIPRGVNSVPGAAATSASDFSQGISAGGGGGGGATISYNTTYYHSGGGGGSGAGAVHFMCNGSFTVSASGYVNGQGGQGGAKSHYSGGGGGGAGGSCWIKAGLGAQIDGVIDLRGGRGGPVGLAYYSDTYAYYNATTYGTPRMGGDGAPGRLVIEAPNYVPGNVDQVRVFGALMTRKVTSLPTTTISQSSPSTNWANGGTVNLGTVNDVRYANLTIGTGTTSLVRLQNRSGSTNRPVRIWVDGNVTVNGALRLTGNGAGLAISTTSTSGELEPMSTTTAGYTMSGTTYVTSSSTYLTGYYGVTGGGDGGRPMGGTTTNINGRSGWEGFDGGGASPGRHKYKQGQGWSQYETGDTGGSGAGNASPGRDGWAPYAAGTIWAYNGAAVDTTGNGVSVSKRVTDSTAGGAQLDASSISTTNFTNYAGSGGGAGNAGGYSSQNWFAAAAHGGGGGGAVAIICQGTVTVNNGASIQAAGGDGNPPGAAYYAQYSHSAGGGGSGGTVYIVANNVSIAPAASESQTSGATFDLRGGYGGGWRQPWSGTRNRYPWYNSYGAFGGDGGYGRLVIDYRVSLNNGRALANRWGYEQSAFVDASQQYRALAGQATFKCRGIPGGTLFRSKFADLGSIVPVVTSLTVAVGQNTSYTLQGQGAQSHPHALGSDGTGSADTGNVSGLVDAGTGLSFAGWRWWRFQGSLSRLSSTGVPPTLDNVKTDFETDLQQ